MSRLLKLVLRSPLATGMSTYAVLWTLADVIEQKAIAKRTHIDFTKTLKTAITGTFYVAPIVYGWVRLNTFVFGSQLALRVAIKKVLSEQIIFSPFAISGFYIVTGALDGKTRGEIVKDLIENKFLVTYLTAWTVWPAFNLLHYTFIPLPYKPAVYGVASFLWSIFLCFMKDDDVHSAIKHNV